MEFKPTITFCESKSHRINDISKPSNPDEAAIFAAAISLWIQANKMENMDKTFCISEIFSGRVNFMSIIMDVARRFEKWSCEHINFETNDETWPYILEESFGSTCAKCIDFTLLEEININDFFKIALLMNMPLIRPLAHPSFKNLIYLE